MDDDFLRELEYLGVTARLKRLSDAFSTGIRELYKAAGVDIEPSWHLVLIKLKRQGQGTMSELAEAFHMSQPAVTKMIGRMVQKGYLTVSRCEKDGRTRVLRLSTKAERRLPQFEKIWRAGRASIREMLRSNRDFLQGLDKLEAEVRRRDFKDRAMKHLRSVR